MKNYIFSSVFFIIFFYLCSSQSVPCWRGPLFVPLLLVVIVVVLLLVKENEGGKDDRGEWAEEEEQGEDGEDELGLDYEPGEGDRGKAEEFAVLVGSKELGGLGEKAAKRIPRRCPCGWCSAGRRPARARGRRRVLLRNGAALPVWRKVRGFVVVDGETSKSLLIAKNLAVDNFHRPSRTN
jgi:hypothetical protein